MSPKKGEEDDDIEFESEGKGDDYLRKLIEDEDWPDPDDYKNWGAYIKALLDDGYADKDDVPWLIEMVSPSGSVNVG